ncbi:acetyltransferase [Xylaria bambusicola]|uniref:acetyltransferase n=1 Tax=Xylaria bambusicola TaxID=326684 RepID=UPI0020083992|nr:acetyltransferase [Xylaria bambusicola]KAI0528267.1 acetyltransferase [Xylaria bambusicola]
MPTTPTFHVRGLSESLGDGQFVIDAYDASLPHLASIGSGKQWGSTPFAGRTDQEEKIKVFRQAEHYQLTGEGPPVQIFIVEAEIPSSAVDELPSSLKLRKDADGKNLLSVGTMMLSQGLYPHYMATLFNQDPIKKELDGTRDYIYLEGLITDFRTGAWRKGVGAVLIEYARQFCREKGQKILYADAYAGNERRLVKYYETQGFHVVDNFEAIKPDGSIWPGVFLRLDVSAS